MVGILVCVFWGCLVVVMLCFLGKGIFGNVRMLFLLYATIGVINVAKCHGINRRTTSVPIKKPKKTLCLQYDKPSVGVCKHNAIIKGCKFGHFLKFRGVRGIVGAPGVYDVSVCMGGNCCLFVAVMGKNGGFMLVCGVLMAVGWGKAGCFECFLRFVAILGFVAITIV